MNKLRAVALTVLIFLSALLPSGCWDSHEINTLSIVAGVGIDTGENTDEFNVTVQIRKVTKPGEGEPKQPFLLLDASGKNVLEALEEIRLRNNRDLFLHQNQVIIISKDQAKKGIRQMLDMFLRYHETRLEVWVIISDSPARDLLQVDLVQEPVTSTALALMMQGRSEISPKMATNMLHVTSNLLEASTAIVTPVVSITEEFGVKKVVIDGSAAIVSDKMVGQLNEDETLGFAIGSSPIKSGMLEVSAEGGTAVLYISDSKASMKTKRVDGHVQADISVDSTLSIAEITGFEGDTLNDVFGKLESAAVNRMVELISDAFKKSCALNADIFGIGSELNRVDPKGWEGIKDDWKNLYPQTVLNITVKGNLLESGKISDSLTMRGEE